MAVPKRRKSKAKRDSRRATHQISAAVFNECPQCSAPKRPHRVCNTCGWYGSRDEGNYVLPVVEVEA